MRTEKLEQDGLALLRVVGEVDFSEVESLVEELRQLQGSSVPNIVVNLAKCSSIVSSAIGVLVGFRCEASMDNRSFWIVTPSEEVRDVLNLVGVLDQLVHPAETEAEAIAALTTNS